MEFICSLKHTEAEARQWKGKGIDCPFGFAGWQRLPGMVLFQLKSYNSARRQDENHDAYGEFG
jgi:hypothetical protein